MQIQVDDAERDEIFARLKAVPENNKCFDCDKKNPKWSSVTLGLYLCLDCAGKHREYGPQISFVRSLNLDTWNKKYITSMELGGNPKALDYFRKQGLKTPYDYKGSQIQKYKQELAKKVDTALAGSKTEAESNKQVFAKPSEEQKTQPEQNHFVSGKSHSDKATHGEKAADDPFANNIVINKAETKTKGFTVEFNKNKPTFGSNKGRIAAKKIENVDLDALTLNEDGGSNVTINKNTFDMTENSLNINTKTNVKEVVSKGNSPYLTEGSAEEKFKKYSNAKAISSDSFNNENNKSWEPSKVRQFAGSKAISSAQYFGDREEESNQGGADYYQTAENVKDFLSHYGNKLKEKADGIVNKLKDEWQQ